MGPHDALPKDRIGGVRLRSERFPRQMSEKKNLDSTLAAFGRGPDVSWGVVQAVVRSAARDTSRARGGLQDLLNETSTVLESLTVLCLAALSPKRLLVLLSPSSAATQSKLDMT